MSQPARHGPLDPLDKIAPRQNSGGAKPLTGVEHELRRPCGRIDLGDLPPLIIEPMRVGLCLLLVVNQKIRAARGPSVEHWAGKDRIGIEHQKALAARSKQRLELDETPTPIAGAD